MRQERSSISETIVGRGLIMGSIFAVLKVDLISWVPFWGNEPPMGFKSTLGQSEHGTLVQPWYKKLGDEGYRGG